MRKQANVLLSFFEKKRAKPVVACKPWKISLEVALSCNLRCITCGHGASVFGGTMSDAVFERVKPLLAWARVVNEVGYGEPFLDRAFADKLDYVKRLGASVFVYSNGMLLNPELCERLVALQLDQITFSVDGGTRETFESIRRGARYAKVLDNIATLHRVKLRRRSKRPVLRANFVGMRRNIEELPPAIRTLAQVGIEEIVLSDMSPPSAELARECLCYHEGLARRMIEEATKAARQCRVTFIAPSVFCTPELLLAESGGGPALAAPQRTGVLALAAAAGDERAILRVDRAHRGGGSNGYCKYPCYEPWQTVYVAHNGDVRPCCAMSRSFGNLLAADIGSIWNSPQYQALRRTVNSRQPAFDECRRCLLRRKVRLPLGEVVRLGMRTVLHQGLAHTARKAVKYLSEYC